MLENRFFPEIKGKLAFGFMRLPMKDEKIDLDLLNPMVDAFFAAGFNYIDTAMGYHSGLSEPAVRDSVAKRYPRDQFVLTTKLSSYLFKTEADVLPYFHKQLERCGVDYFDFYLIHAITRENYPKFQTCRAFEHAAELKAEGKIRHVGFSFHDGPELLEQVLKDHPETEIVQLQINYLDWDDTGVCAAQNYAICEKYNVPVLVMEPVKGGGLVNLDPPAQILIDELNAGRERPYSNAGYAMRYAASLPQVACVLSGMSTIEQIRDNCATLQDLEPLSEGELHTLRAVADILHGKRRISCTACRYCTDGCPMAIPIPDLFADFNAKTVNDLWNATYYYSIHTTNCGKASDCIQCGFCESVCPQHLPIRDLLKEVAEAFEPKK